VIGVGLTIVLLDQLTKWLVVQSLGPDQRDHRVELLGSWFAFHYAENTGAAFGMLTGQGWLLTVIAGVVAMVLLASVVRMAKPSRLVVLGCGLLLGGALGNLVDRLRFGYVVDFISVSSFPKFNIADSAITFGILVLAAPLLRGPQSAIPERVPDQMSATHTTSHPTQGPDSNRMVVDADR
jgi:signal peptidase II